MGIDNFNKRRGNEQRAPERRGLNFDQYKRLTRYLEGPDTTKSQAFNISGNAIEVPKPPRQSFNKASTSLRLVLDGMKKIGEIHELYEKHFTEKLATPDVSPQKSGAKKIDHSDESRSETPSSSDDQRSQTTLPQIIEKILLTSDNVMNLSKKDLNDYIQCTERLIKDIDELNSRIKNIDNVAKELDNQKKALDIERKDLPSAHIADLYKKAKKYIEEIKNGKEDFLEKAEKLPENLKMATQWKIVRELSKTIFAPLMRVSQEYDMCQKLLQQPLYDQNLDQKKEEVQKTLNFLNDKTTLTVARNNTKQNIDNISNSDLTDKGKELINLALEIKLQALEDLANTEGPRLLQEIQVTQAKIDLQITYRKAFEYWTTHQQTIRDNHLDLARPFYDHLCQVVSKLNNAELLTASTDLEQTSAELVDDNRNLFRMLGGIEYRRFDATNKDAANYYDKYHPSMGDSNTQARLYFYITDADHNLQMNMPEKSTDPERTFVELCKAHNKLSKKLKDSLLRVARSELKKFCVTYKNTVDFYNENTNAIRKLFPDLRSYLENHFNQIQAMQQEPLTELKPVELANKIEERKGHHQQFSDQIKKYEYTLQIRQNIARIKQDYKTLEAYRVEAVKKIKKYSKDKPMVKETRGKKEYKEFNNLLHNYKEGANLLKAFIKEGMKEYKSLLNQKPITIDDLKNKLDALDAHGKVLAKELPQVQEFLNQAQAFLNQVEHAPLVPPTELPDSSLIRNETRSDNPNTTLSDQLNEAFNSDIRSETAREKLASIRIGSTNRSDDRAPGSGQESSSDGYAGSGQESSSDDWASGSGGQRT